MSQVRKTTDLTAAQRDRACGVLLGVAAGDAPGVGYEFANPPGPGEPVGTGGGGLGPFNSGEWTAATAMAIAIAEIAATGADLGDEVQQDRIVQRWGWWARNAKDVGVQTRAVLSGAGRNGSCARTARDEAAALHRRTGRTAGNGSLMRTAPVALAYLDDEKALAKAARAVSELTHYDPDAGDACVLWSTAIAHAVRTGQLDARIGLGHLDSERREPWASRLEEAEKSRPDEFADRNGWVVAALQGAWSAIVHTPAPADDPGRGVFGVDRLRLALQAAVRGGGDTDTVAAIAGGLLGAAYGASAVPAHWRLALHGWPGLRSRGLIALANTIIGSTATAPYPYRAVQAAAVPGRHPHDERVWIGGVRALTEPRPFVPADVDAVVSLYRVGDGAVPAGVEHLDVRLSDHDGENSNLDFVLLDTVRAIEQLRAEGRTVYVHGLQGVNRTPAVAALYGARKRGIDIDQALEEVAAVLPDANPGREFRAALRRLHPQPNTTTGGAR